MTDVLEVMLAEIRLKRPGEKLPPIREMAKRLGVSPGTIQGVVHKLTNQGVLKTQVGRGTFVALPPGLKKVRRVTILRDDHPSSHEEAIQRALQSVGNARGLQTLTMGFSDIDHAIDLVPMLTPSDAYILRSLSGPFPLALLNRLRGLSPAIVVAHSAVSGIDVDIVSTDVHQLFPLALDHLTELGHREMLFVASQSQAVMRGKEEGFLEQLTWRGLPAEPERVLFADTKTYDEAASHTKSFLEKALDGNIPPFTAVVTSDCPSAQAVLEVCARRGLQVPDDVSVVALDLPDLDSRYTENLTMVGRTSTQIADAIYDCLEFRWDHPDAPYSLQRKSPQLVVRSSTAPCCK